LRTKTTTAALAVAALVAACSAGVVIAGGTSGPKDNTKDIERALDRTSRRT
jgi:DhnA family fructose-bisphosphate aldolase class Ia